MGTTNATELKNQEGTRSTARPWALVLWPWAMMIAAWTLALLAVLTNQTYLTNHHGPAGVPGLLAGDDDGDDASIEPAYDVHDGACQPKTESPTRSTNGFPGRICSRLDGIRCRSLPGRHPDSPAGA